MRDEDFRSLYIYVYNISIYIYIYIGTGGIKWIGEMDRQMYTDDLVCGQPCIFSWPMVISSSVSEFFVAV